MSLKIIPQKILIVDCLLGSGVKGVLRPPYYELVKQVNEFENILSVDTYWICIIYAVKPQETITFHEEKWERSEIVEKSLLGRGFLRN